MEYMQHAAILASRPQTSEKWLREHDGPLGGPSCLDKHLGAPAVSDQTPTPTRFLKNCEEVGLFTDLDCSIEQEFCKAQEEEDSKQVGEWSPVRFHWGSTSAAKRVMSTLSVVSFLFFFFFT